MTPINSADAITASPTLREVSIWDATAGKRNSIKDKLVQKVMDGGGEDMVVYGIGHFESIWLVE